VPLIRGLLQLVTLARSNQLVDLFSLRFQGFVRLFLTKKASKSYGTQITGCTGWMKSVPHYQLRNIKNLLFLSFIDCFVKSLIPFVNSVDFKSDKGDNTDPDPKQNESDNEPSNLALNDVVGLRKLFALDV